MKNYYSHLIDSSATLLNGLIAINELKDGILCLFVIDKDQRLIGTLTDGDIRRSLIKGISLSDSISMAMRKDFKAIVGGKLDPAKIKTYRLEKIKLLPSLDNEGRIIKVFDLVSKRAILPIDAVLMAGGKGERLRPLTEKTPKPLLKVGDKAIIDFNIDRLLLYGIENIHVTVNYLADQIESHFDNDNYEVKINCVREPKYFGTLGSVKYIKKFNNEVILVMNSDIFSNIDFEDFYDHFINSNADISVAAVPYSVNIPFGIIEMNNINIKGLSEKPTYNYLINGGIYLIKQKLFDLIPAETFFDATSFIQLSILKGFKVVSFPLIGYWIDIGKLEDFTKVQEFAKHIRS
jgi:dTDP-glucose pyrophosphorylase